VESLLGIVSECPELAELRQLAARGDSWLLALREAHAGLFVPPMAPRKPAEDNGLIITSMAQSALPVDADLLAAWQAELKALALRFREAMVDS
jgi:tRNA nucleotidyltransferase/poly(A) polymerase